MFLSPSRFYATENVGSDQWFEFPPATEPYGRREEEKKFLAIILGFPNNQFNDSGKSDFLGVSDNCDGSDFSESQPTSFISNKNFSRENLSDCFQFSGLVISRCLLGRHERQTTSSHKWTFAARFKTQDFSIFPIPLILLYKVLIRRIYKLANFWFGDTATLVRLRYFAIKNEDLSSILCSERTSLFLLAASRPNGNSSKLTTTKILMKIPTFHQSLIVELQIL